MLTVISVPCSLPSTTPQHTLFSYILYSLFPLVFFFTVISVPCSLPSTTPQRFFIFQSSWLTCIYFYCLLYSLFFFLYAALVFFCFLSLCFSLLYSALCFPICFFFSLYSTPFSSLFLSVFFLLYSTLSQIVTAEWCLPYNNIREGLPIQQH